jgi:hypothetical protein
MAHVDPELLALLALGETAGTDDERAHLADCDGCMEELRVLRRTALVGRSTLADGDLLEPDPRVWNRIADEVGMRPLATVGRPARRRTLWTGLAIAASVVLLAGAGVAAWVGLNPAAQAPVASATLEAFPGWPGASGEASVRESGDRWVLTLDLDVPEDAQGYREVWLITSDASQLVSLGVVEGSSGEYVIPRGVDLADYDLVDVSEEPFDGDPAHSGDSIVRGQLS